MLEDRLTPADFTLVATADIQNLAQYQDANNWTKAGVSDFDYPVDDDSIHFGNFRRVSEFGKPPPPSVNCYIPTAYRFDRIYLDINYASEVTVQDDTSATILRIDNGTLSQFGNNSDLTVTQKMEFFGGTITSVTNGIVHLSTPASQTSIIGGAANTTVTMGSVLDINGNAKLNYTAGTIAFKNGAYFNCLGGGTVDPNLGVKGHFTHAGGTNKPHIVIGTFTLAADSQKAFKVEGGQLKITVSLEIAGHTDPADTTTPSLGMSSGGITAKNGIQLKATNGFHISGGTFQTLHVGTLAYDNTLYITGNMKVTGGEIVMSDDGNGEYLGTTTVTGNVTFTGGKYFAKIRGVADSVQRNRWISSGTFTTAAAATVQPDVVGIAALPAAVLPARAWNVITGYGLFPMTPALPTVVGAGFTGELRAGRDEYDLKW